ncbi:DUF4190 domain-containing protein [Actinoplanes derwentensis]|uniref:DUF4190 domain-containing protein n=1 Tax=Actinoplanes derwentensis TaxID=113562 RepID=A0A1H1V9W5_9ACTN|nr:DUF4190 domain-containing protein [Actinoplanes derwentensis]GID83768.1 hypothetical protein Ade03nite_26920 [Actinoplanes derwentensis]SDS81552.1 protein of unknown function [Actinoplanes derwentensis]
MSYPPPGPQDPYGQQPPYPPQPYPGQPYSPQPYPQQYHGHYRPHPMSGPPMSGPPMTPYPPQPGYYPPPPMAVVVPTSGLAVASLIFGLIGFFGGFCAFGIPCAFAVLFGHLALRETKNGHRSGHGMAVAGLILGYILLVPAIIVIAMGGFGAVLGAVTPATSP